MMTCVEMNKSLGHITWNEERNDGRVFLILCQIKKLHELTVKP